MSDSLTAVCADLVREPPQDRTGRATFRIHNARACWRQRWYQAVNEPISDPRADLDELAMWAGKMWHELVGAALVKAHGALLEVPVDWRPQVDLDGTADAVYDDNGAPICVEVKTMHSYAFRRAEKEGPRIEHLVQAGCYALAPQIGAQAVRMIYVDRLSGDMRSWMVGLDNLIPGHGTLRQVVRDELADIAALGKAIPTRVIPGVGEITADEVRAGVHWQCRYCIYRRSCAG
jgi:hypothetical protein